MTSRLNVYIIDGCPGLKRAAGCCYRNNKRIKAVKDVSRKDSSCGSSVIESISEDSSGYIFIYKFMFKYIPALVAVGIFFNERFRVSVIALLSLRTSVTLSAKSLKSLHDFWFLTARAYFIFSRNIFTYSASRDIVYLIWRSAGSSELSKLTRTYYLNTLYLEVLNIAYI